MYNSAIKRFLTLTNKAVNSFVLFGFVLAFISMNIVRYPLVKEFSSGKWINQRDQQVYLADFSEKQRVEIARFYLTLDADFRRVFNFNTKTVQVQVVVSWNDVDDGQHEVVVWDKVLHWDERNKAIKLENKSVSQDLKSPIQSLTRAKNGVMSLKQEIIPWFGLLNRVTDYYHTRTIVFPSSQFTANNKDMELESDPKFYSNQQTENKDALKEQKFKKENDLDLSDKD